LLVRRECPLRTIAIDTLQKLADNVYMDVSYTMGFCTIPTSPFLYVFLVLPPLSTHLFSLHTGLLPVHAHPSCGASSTAVGLQSIAACSLNPPHTATLSLVFSLLSSPHIHVHPFCHQLLTLPVSVSCGLLPALCLSIANFQCLTHLAHRWDIILQLMFHTSSIHIVYSGRSDVNHYHCSILHSHACNRTLQSLLSASQHSFCIIVSNTP
jgi:hypothetical protein